ncbi:MAG: glycogen-binding domain-containing protein [Gemmatimonadetes bacterium]|nr:glycogen-binding domain-containing protein [Gemmatimonadota bacterium]
MDERIHACLDGELRAEDLTPAERARLTGLQSALAETVTVLRAAPVPDFTDRVMNALPSRPAVQSARPAALRQASLWERARLWLWEPRPVSFRPAYALAGAMSLALAAIAVPEVLEQQTSAEVAGTYVAPVPGGQRLYVQFRLEAPEASMVTLAGSFNEWQPTLELREAAPGVWTALVPLTPGVHDYTFVVDGERWVADPYAPQVDDSFGGTNSRLFLPAPAGSV